MTTLAAAIAALEPVGDGWRGTVPANWMQGRTAYGGFSTALALVAAQRSDDDLPPLRSVQVAFVGPLAGTVAVRARRLRRGRNAAFVQVDIEGEAGLELRATFVFMRAIDTALDLAAGTAPSFAFPGEDTRLHPGIAAVPFTRNFAFVDRREGLGPAEWLRWARLIDRDGLDSLVELVAVADVLPPAALKLVGGPVPVSSMTWLLNLLTPTPATRDGWWLLRAAADHARGGASSQTMAIWDAEGRAVAEQMQSVAIFA